MANNRDIYSLTLHLTNINPDADEFGIKDVVEELLHRRLDAEDFQTLRAAFVRVALSKAEFAGGVL